MLQNFIQIYFFTIEGKFTFLLSLQVFHCRGQVEIDFKTFYTKYYNSFDGSACKKVSRRDSRCTYTFHICLLSDNLFKQCVQTKTFRDNHAGTTEFGNTLNEKVNNPWKIKVDKTEVYFQDFPLNIFM